MPIDLKAIDDRIHKLQRIKEFVKEFSDDPDFEYLLAEFASKNGHLPKPASLARSQPSNNSGNGSARPRGYFVGAVQGVIAQLGHDFTTADIERKLRSLGVEIRAANVNVAINE